MSVSHTCTVGSHEAPMNKVQCEQYRAATTAAAAVKQVPAYDPSMFHSGTQCWPCSSPLSSAQTLSRQLGPLRLLPSSQATWLSMRAAAISWSGSKVPAPAMRTRRSRSRGVVHLVAVSQHVEQHVLLAANLHRQHVMWPATRGRPGRLKTEVHACLRAESWAGTRAKEQACKRGPGAAAQTAPLTYVWQACARLSRPATSRGMCSLQPAHHAALTRTRPTYNRELAGWSAAAGVMKVAVATRSTRSSSARTCRTPGREVGGGWQMPAGVQHQHGMHVAACNNMYSHAARWLSKTKDSAYMCCAS
ncbi:hypothetical protein ABPG75_000013 [Micractinium tetrahymenae]